MNPLLQILAIVTPLVVQGIANIQAERAAANLPTPTPDELEALLAQHFLANLDAILAQGTAWSDAHPKETP